jgi:DNA-binding NtrC family response regulator
MQLRGEGVNFSVMDEAGNKLRVAKILVTDDEPACRDSIQKVLEREGYEVETASDVDTALGLLRTQRFDLVVCDYRMPGKTGIDLLRELREQRSQVPVLMISAFADTVTENSALRQGAFVFLKKPFRRQALVDNAAKALRG